MNVPILEMLILLCLDHLKLISFHVVYGKDFFVLFILPFFSQHSFQLIIRLINCASANDLKRGIIHVGNFIWLSPASLQIKRADILFPSNQHSNRRRKMIASQPS